MLNRCIFIILLLVSNVALAEQVKLFKSFTPDNPLSYQFVRSIVQDDDGFIWLGSHEGLHRYDGKHFVSYHHDAQIENSLSSDVVSTMLIDSKQRFWVATSGAGLNLYQELSKNFQHFSTLTEDAKLTNDVINSLFEDSEGKLWIGTEKGLNILSVKDNHWHVQQIVQVLGNENSLTHDTIHDVIQVNNNEVWVATHGGGISVFSLQGRFIRAIKFGDSNSSSYSNKFVNSMFLDNKQNVWIGTVDSGLLKYHLPSKQLQQYQYNEKDQHSITSNNIKEIYQDSKQQLWIATDKGLIIYQENTDNFKRYNHAATDPFSLNNDFILCFFEDKNNMMWIGTFTGVNRYDPNMASFRQYSSINHPALSNNNVTSFSQLDPERILFSTYSGGIYQLSVSDNVITQFQLDDYFSELRIMTTYIDHKTNSLWLGTRTDGLYQINLTSKAVVHYQHEPDNIDSISANSITDIVKDLNGNIWVATFHQGLNKLNSDGSFTRYIKQQSQPSLGPSSNHILQLLVDVDGTIWLGTYGGGLNRFFPEKNQFIHIKNVKGESDSISSDIAWVLLQDNQKNIWVGTQAAGLNLLSHENFEREHYTFSHFDTKDGLKSRTVYGIAQDKEGDIWFSTNKGLTRFSPLKNKFVHFDLSHGLIDLEYNHSSVFLAADNTIYFGAGKGISSVKPEDINGLNNVPDVKLTNVMKLNEPMSFSKPLTHIDALTFDYSDNLISFEYAGLNYSNPKATRYKYRLLGFEQQWINAGDATRATYTNLPPGQYQLQIIASSSDELWSKPYQVEINVKPAPWNTWWAYLAYAVIIALSLLLYAKALNRKLLQEQQQKELLKQQVAEKTERYLSKNTELEHANKQLEKAATIDKVTGIKSRRYLDIYIEQASQLMNNIHQNLLPIQRSVLPRLYIVMVRINDMSTISNSQLINLTDLLLYSRNPEDLVIRWADDTFAIIGYEKENSAAELSHSLAKKLPSAFENQVCLSLAYSFYPFNIEQPVETSWDQVNVLIELGLNLVEREANVQWLGLCKPKEQPFDYLSVLQQHTLDELKNNIVIKHG